jgi:hypothetical protein
MKPIYITEEELEYLTNVPQVAVACEPAISLKPQMSFEEEAKDCITLEEFSRKLDEAIRRRMPNP